MMWKTDQIFGIRKGTDQRKTVWFEPLADELELRSKVLYEFEFAVTDGHKCVQLDVTEDGLIVHGWVHKSTSIEENGHRTVGWQYSDKLIQ